VGNVDEWVADWADLNDTSTSENISCTDVTSALGVPGSDLMCFGGNSSVHIPGALARGGTFDSGVDAGGIAVRADFAPSDFLLRSGPTLGQRPRWGVQ
jgi:hypothetical protein